jgi:hypothetical protein
MKEKAIDVLKEETREMSELLSRTEKETKPISEIEFSGEFEIEKVEKDSFTFQIGRQNK